jgi:alpha-1,6-mannosyltransferase
MPFLPDLHRIVRSILGLFNAVALISFTSGVRQAYGKVAAGWFMILQASQFHIIYYASRTLPNMFAFCISKSYSGSTNMAVLTIGNQAHLLFVSFYQIQAPA